MGYRHTLSEVLWVLHFLCFLVILILILICQRGVYFWLYGLLLMNTGDRSIR